MLYTYGIQNPVRLSSSFVKINQRKLFQFFTRAALRREYSSHGSTSSGFVEHRHTKHIKRYIWVFKKRIPQHLRLENLQHSEQKESWTQNKNTWPSQSNSRNELFSLHLANSLLEELEPAPRDCILF